MPLRFTGATILLGIILSFTAAQPNQLKGISNSALREAEAVIKRYYQAINKKNYREAYRQWEDCGKASRQSFQEFKSGFAQTASVKITIGQGQLEGAAGSQYVELPIDIQVITKAQQRQHFRGTYTLRRTLVDGASEEARVWHIYSAHIVAVKVK